MSDHPIQDGFADGSGSTVRREAGPSLSLLAAVKQAEYMAEEMRAILDKRSAKGDELRDAIRIGLSAMSILMGKAMVEAKKEAA